MSNLNFENKAVIVTGAGNGLGKAYALELGSRGAKVIVNDLGGSVDGSGAASSPYDSVATKDGGESIVQSALDNFGTVDAVINNAGILRDKSFANMSEEELTLILDVHLKGTFFVSQPAFKVMKENNYGRIVNVASPSGLFGNFGQSNYGAAKMGIVGLTNVLAIEGAKYNIKVNVIAPTAYTRMTEALLPEDVGKLFSAELVTPMVVYLASESCEPSHEIFGVAAGRFARIGIITHNGYVNTNASAEDIANNIEEIRTIKDGTYPMSNEDELLIIQKAIQGN